MVIAFVIFSDGQMGNGRTLPTGIETKNTNSDDDIVVQTFDSTSLNILRFHHYQNEILSWIYQKFLFLFHLSIFIELLISLNFMYMRLFIKRNLCSNLVSYASFFIYLVSKIKIESTKTKKKSTENFAMIKI